MTKHAHRDAEVLVEVLRLRPGADVDTLRERWSLVSAPAMANLARREGGAVWLRRRLAALEIPLSADVHDVLTSIARDTAAHCLRVDAELERTAVLLEAAGIECIPLKGAAMRAIARRVPYADARRVGDVDVLCRFEDARRAFDVLGAEGYSSPRLGPVDGHHLPPLVGQHGVGVDIHVTTVPQVSPAEAWRRASAGDCATMISGRMRRIPSETELLWHALSHSLATVEEVAYSGLRLRHWLDAAALVASGASIDWECIARRLDGGECAHPSLARDWLRTAVELSGDHEMPSCLEGTPRLHMTRLLAWRLSLVEAPPTRWSEKLLEEGTRGEAGLPLEPAGETRHALVRARHAMASRAARSYWRVSLSLSMGYQLPAFPSASASFQPEPEH